MQGTLYIFAAPSGAGKTSLVKALLASTDRLRVSISHTTRPKRRNEIDGINYHFVSQNIFNQMVINNDFLEHALVFNHGYGTSKTWVLNQLDQGLDVILEIDWQGAQIVHQLMPNSVKVFILPPSIETLHQRLIDRDEDNDEVIASRMSQAINEISHYNEFDYIVINDDFDTALTQLRAIIISNHLKLAKQQEKYAHLIANLLN